MIREVKAYRLLTGFRGTPPRDIPAIVDILIKFLNS
jgi:acetyl-CoA synthetase (ADP-forming)